MKLPNLNIDQNKLGNILLIIGCVWYVTNCGTPAVIQQEDPNKVEYLIKIHDLEKQVNDYESALNSIKTIYEKDTANINNSNRVELEHFFTGRYE